MRKLLVIGIGAGDPGHLTVQAIDALNRTDVFFIPDKGNEKADLRNVRLEICRRYIRNDSYRSIDIAIPKRSETVAYRDGVDSWHAALGVAYARALRHELADGKTGAFLVWGDPALYDSTLRIVDRIIAEGLDLDVEVIPGISSIQVLAARHRIALNRIGAPVAIVPGRCLAEGFPPGIDDIVVVLDGDHAYRKVADDDPDIFWGAYLGTSDECLVAGRLGDVVDEIEAVRAQKRAAKGWVMDTYLLRRRR